MTIPETAEFAQRSNAHVFGEEPQTLLCAHGFSSNQNIFRHQIRDLHFRGTHRIVTYDLAGFGQSDPQLWNAERHARLEGYAEDMLRLIEELDLHNITLLGVPGNVGQSLQQNLPNAQLTLLPGVGHLPNFTAPEAFNRTLMMFLTRVTANFGVQVP